MTFSTLSKPCGAT